MARTAQEQLDAIDAAIAKIEGGAQSYSIDNITYTRADLAALYAERKRLQGQITATSRGGARVRLGRPI